MDCLSLVDACRQCLVELAQLDCLPVIQRLPPHLKDGIREKLLRRRLISPSELASLLHDRVQAIDLEDQEHIGDLVHVLAPVKSFRKISLNRTFLGLTTLPLNQSVYTRTAPPPSSEQEVNMSNRNINLSSEQEVDMSSRNIHPSSEQLVNFLIGQFSLHTLFLRGVENLNTEVFMALAECSNLIHLDISRCRGITDEFIGLISEGCGRLESLSLSGTDITDVGLSFLARSESRRSLKELRIDRCRHITDDGIQVLLEGMAALEILLFHGCPQVTEASRQTLEEYLLNHARNVRQLTWTVY